VLRREERMRTLYLYLGGWAFVLGMCLSAIAGAAGANDYSPPEVSTVFEHIARSPWRFGLAVLLLWLAYSIPFVAAVEVARSGLSGLYRKVKNGLRFPGGPA
jgi:hypothetical protein